MSLENGESYRLEVPAIRNSVPGGSLATSDFAVSTACCQRVRPSLIRVNIDGEVSRTIMVRPELPVKDGISGRATANTINRPMVTARTTDRSLRSFFHNERSSRRSNTLFQ